MFIQGKLNPGKLEKSEIKIKFKIQAPMDKGLE